MDLFGKKKVFLDSAAGRDNPSALYEDGQKAKEKLEAARVKIARSLSVQARDIIFSSGGTESDNLAVLGAFEAAKEKLTRPHIIISSLEHPAVLESAKEAERRGAELTIVEANEEGAIDSEDIRNALKENTVLVSVSLVSGEVGVVQNIGKIGRIIREFRKMRDAAYPYLHTDASQAETVIKLNPEGLHADLMTLDSAKVGGPSPRRSWLRPREGGPKGVGALVVRPGVALRPIIFGGGQERGLRSGTENVEGIAGFVEAFVAAQEGSKEEFVRLMELRKIFVSGVEALPGAMVEGSRAQAAPHIVSVTFPGELHEWLAIQLAERGVLVSTGVSCNTNKDSEERQALRFSFGPQTTRRDIETALKALREIRKV